MRYLPFMLILLAGFLVPAGAADSLSTVQVPVRDQSRGERDRAVTTAMETAVLRLVGREEVLAAPEVRSILDAGPQYLQQYSYETIEPVALDADGSGDAGEVTRLAFRASFNVEGIARRLQANGVPLWARERPLTLVWVAYSTGTERQLLRRGSSTGLQAGLLDDIRRAGERRGVPLALPAGSSASSEGPRVAFTDVWGVFDEPLLEAANAVDSDNVLAVRLFEDGNSWIGRFTLLGSAVDRGSWETQAPSPGSALAAGIGRLAETYAAEFSVVPTLGGGSLARLEIENVTGLDDYGRVVKYLSGLSAVESLQLSNINGSKVELSLQLSGTTRALERAIELGRVLQAASSDDVVPLGSIAGIDFATDRILRYRYRQN